MSVLVWLRRRNFTRGTDCEICVSKQDGGIRWAAALLLLVMLSGYAGILTWKTMFSSESPDRKAVLRVEERACFASNRRESRLAQHEDRGKDGLRCIFRARGVVGNCRQIRVAYDCASDRVVDFKTAEPWLREAIIRDYGVTAEELKANSGDVFKWATYPGHCCSCAVDVFRKRFPQY
jgi:hypothetical protein